MVSDRMRRRIETLLDEADEAVGRRQWAEVRDICDAVLRLEPENAEAQALLEASERDTGVRSFPESAPFAATATSPEPGGAPAVPPSREPTLREPQGGLPKSEAATTPTLFANGRYRVSKFLGEGGKKRVYLAHDTLLDREVAFALIKTEGFDLTSKERISREAQAMGRLGVHPNIVAVLDLGQEEDGTPYMVTEMMGGGDVEGLLEKTTPKPPPSQGGGHLEPSPSQGEDLGVGRLGLPCWTSAKVGHRSGLN
ncbi:MAG: protein kinase [Chloroflexi bacterium]|nr:protein kinase [Chloroflexota bacterium]